MLVSSTITALLVRPEEFCSTVKGEVPRIPVTTDDILSGHICTSIQMVTQADCQAQIRQAVFILSKGISEEI